MKTLIFPLAILLLKISSAYKYYTICFYFEKVSVTSSNLPCPAIMFFRTCQLHDADIPGIKSVDSNKTLAHKDEDAFFDCISLHFSALLQQLLVQAVMNKTGVPTKLEFTTSISSASADQ